MTYSTDARLDAMHTAYVALAHTLIRAGTLDGEALDRSAALARTWLGRSGAERDAVHAFDDIMRSVTAAVDWGGPPPP